MLRTWLASREPHRIRVEGGEEVYTVKPWSNGDHGQQTLILVDTLVASLGDVFPPNVPFGSRPVVYAKLKSWNNSGEPNTDKGLLALIDDWRDRRLIS